MPVRETAGASMRAQSGKSFNNFSRSFTGKVRSKCFMRTGMIWFLPKYRNACISNPLNRPAVAIFFGVVWRNWISCLPIFTVRDGLRQSGIRPWLALVRRDPKGLQWHKHRRVANVCDLFASQCLGDFVNVGRQDTPISGCARGYS